VSTNLKPNPKFALNSQASPELQNEAHIVSTNLKPNPKFALNPAHISQTLPELQNELYQKIGESVVNVAANVASIAYNVYKANEPLIRSIAFSSPDVNTYYSESTFSSSAGEMFASFASLSSSFQIPVMPSLGKFGSHKRESPIIEEISDEEDIPKTIRTNPKLPSSHSVKRITKQEVVNAKKDVKAKKVVNKKDVIIPVVKKEVVEKVRPKGRIFEDVPENIHLNDKFLADLEKLSGPSTLNKMMPTLGVAVSKLRRRN
jgi:hypothetical protein